jgi:hypothetical protein
MEALGASTNLDNLNALTRTRFLPDPITEEVTTEIEKPSEDWEPVTVVTKTKEIEVPIQPGIQQTVPISVPEVTINDMVTVVETITDTYSVVPEAMDVVSELDFQINYKHSLSHLLLSWCMLGGLGLVFALCTAYVLRRKDIK